MARDGISVISNGGISVMLNGRPIDHDRVAQIEAEKALHHPPPLNLKDLTLLLDDGDLNEDGTQRLNDDRRSGKTLRYGTLVQDAGGWVIKDVEMPDPENH